MKLGGNASYVADVTTAEELRQIYLKAKQLEQPVYMIGGGSNLIVHDNGFDGVIIRNAVQGIETIDDTKDTTTIRAGGGVIWDNLVAYTVDQGLSGIEAMSGIPGTVGAAPVQNIGAYGQEFADTFESLQAYDTANDSFVTLTAEDCSFSYRYSIFRGAAEGRYAIVNVTLKLYKTPPQPPYYESLQRYFEANQITNHTVEIVRGAVLHIRSSKLPDPKNLPNSGSFFKNAVIEKWQADPLIANYPDMPHYVLPDHKIKIPAGWLIEQCELKGIIINGIKVHDHNAVVLINQSATSYLQLAEAREKVVASVRNKFQITLEQEPLEIP